MLLYNYNKVGVTMYYENLIKKLSKEIEILRYVCSVCIELLEFKGPETLVELKKDGLHNALRQVVYNSNYNKIKKIEREAGKAKDAYASGSYIKKIIEKKVYDKELTDEVYKKFRYGIDDAEDVRKLLLQSLHEIKMRQEEIKNCEKSLAEDKIEKARLDEEKRKREEERKRQKEDDYTPTYTSSSHSYSSLEETQPVQRKSTYKTNTTREPVSIPKVKRKQGERIDYTSSTETKKRTALFVTDRERMAEEIIKEYGITGFGSLHFDNKENAEKVIEIYDIEQALQQKREVTAFRIAMAFNEMLDIAVEEAMSGRTKYDANTGMRKLIRDFGGPDYIERYQQMYENYYKYVDSLPKSERESFRNQFENTLYSDLKQGSSLIPPEEFKRKVNQRITAELVKGKWSIKESRMDILEYNTKYMDARDIANIYQTICRDNPYTNHSDYDGIKDVCIELILKRMPPVDINKENFHEILEKRREAIKSDYFFALVSGDVKEGYAKELVSQKELVTEKKKEYFRMSKFKQALATMSFKRLLELAKKQELTEREQKEIGRMFQ